MVAACLVLLAGGASAEPQPREAIEAEIRREFILANLEFTLLHEFGHALFQEFDVPVLGLEEDAADQFATVIMIGRHLRGPGKADVDRLVFVAGEWLAEWEETAGDPSQRHAYWDMHSLAIQRFYNVNCLAYGAAADELSDMLDSAALPAERGFFCEDMFEEARRAVLWVLDAYGRDEEGPIRGARKGVPVVFDLPNTPEAARMKALVEDDPLFRKTVLDAGLLFQWPVEVKVVFLNCPGDPDAYYNRRVHEITICYELLSTFENLTYERRDRMLQELCGNASTRRLFRERVPCDEILAELGQD